MTDVDPGIVPDFVAVDGGNPRLNPRVRVAITAPVLKVLADADYVIGDEITGRTPYADLCRRYDIPYIFQTNLVKEDGLWPCCWQTAKPSKRSHCAAPLPTARCAARSKAFSPSSE